MTPPPFSRMLEVHGPAVYRYLAATVGRDADDCYQETVLSALRAYGDLRHADQLRSWLFTIASRKAIDSHRARGRRAVPVANVPDVAGEASEVPSVPGIEGEPALWAQVRILPPKQREAVVLRFVADLSHAEVAATMGSSVEAARRNVHEGIKKLREELA